MSWLSDRIATGTPAAVGHRSRCKAIKRNSKDPSKIGKQCSKFACRGHQFCKSHGGKTSKQQLKGAQNADDRVSAARAVERLPEVYSRYLSNKLSERMAELAGVPDELDLKEELALLRSTAIDAAQLYDLAANAPDNTKDIQQLRVAAGAIVRETLSEVRDMVESIVAIEEKRRETLTVPSLHIVVTQIVDLMYDELGDVVPVDKIRGLANRMKDIRLPSDEVQGTVLTPDMDVREMDETIPSAPPGADAPRIAIAPSSHVEEKAG